VNGPGKDPILGFIAGVTIGAGPAGRPVTAFTAVAAANAERHRGRKLDLSGLGTSSRTHGSPSIWLWQGCTTPAGGLGPVFGYGSLFTLGLALGLIGLVAYDKYLTSRVSRAGRRGPGAMAATETAAGIRGIATWSNARRLALMIAVAIGLHNFAESLAIEQSAASGEVALGTALVIGSALHNATEGFGSSPL
jgi:zinc transporter ZupT